MSANKLSRIRFRRHGPERDYRPLPSLHPPSSPLAGQDRLEAKNPPDGPLLWRCIRHCSSDNSGCYDYNCKFHSITASFGKRNQHGERITHLSQSGPEGAIAGSQWACRETFVSVVVSNLPIIQPLIRKGFRKIGLSQLFSSSGKPSGQTYPLSSRGLQTLTRGAERNTKKSKSDAGPTRTQVSAWGSDEHILTTPEPTSKDITVVSETIVHSEPFATEEMQGENHAAASPKEWDSRLSGR